MTPRPWTSAARAIVAALALLCLLPGRSAAQPFRVTFQDDGTPHSLEVGQHDCVPLALRNDGTTRWTRAERFRVGYHWLDRQGAVVVLDGGRTDLPRDVEPGQSLALCADLLAPGTAGTYELRWDLVQEGVTWFSGEDPANALSRWVTVAPPPPARPGPRSVLTALLFWLVTIGSFALTAYWVRVWCGPDLSTRDEYLFHAVVFGLGQLYVVLHALVFTVGLTLPRVVLVLAMAHASIAAACWRTLARRPATSRAPETDVPVRRMTAMELVGAAVVGAVFLEWAWTASRSLQVLGTDAAHYHVPHALNFLHGVNPFVFLATPHAYPMGTGVWAAWFFVPFGDPLLLELATAPAFLLLFASACLTFRILTGRSGIAWVPWALLPAFTLPLPSLTLLMSADLAYAAAFVALVAQMLLVWQGRRLDARQVCASALCAGVLVSTKSTGLASAALIGLVGAGLVLTRPRAVGQPALRRSWLLAAGGLFIATGGIWLVRNWWLFGSPLAPFGLSLGEARIFPGQSAAGMRYHLSVLGDLRQQRHYPLALRVGQAVRDMFGSAVIPAAALSFLLVLDIAQQLVRRRALDRETRAKIVFSTFFLAALTAHALLLVRLPWTSLDWTKNLSLRYLLPFFPLYVIGLYSFAFMGQVTWRHARTLSAVSAALLVPGALWYYATHQSTPGLPPEETVGALRLAPLAVSAALVAALSAASAGWHAAVCRRAALGLAISIAAALAWTGAADHERALRVGERAAEREVESLRVGLPPTFAHRGLYWKVREFQQTAGIHCEQSRFFLASRFDLPLDLQDARYRNVVVDIGVSSREAAEELRRGRRGCDFVVGIRAELARDGQRLGDLFGGRAPELAAVYRSLAAYTKP